MTLVSSPTTSEIASVTVRPADAAARRPPFTSDRCLRTQLTARMSASARSRRRVTSRFASSGTPGAGAVINADAPPESSTTMQASGPTPRASSRAARPALTLHSSGTGCAAATCVNGGGSDSPPAGLTSTPRRSDAGSAATNARAMGTAAFPAASRSIGAAVSASMPRASARSTSAPASAAPIAAATICRRSARSVVSETVSGISWDPTRPRGRSARRSCATSGSPSVRRSAGRRGDRGSRGSVPAQPRHRG